MKQLHHFVFLLLAIGVICSCSTLPTQSVASDFIESNSSRDSSRFQSFYSRTIDTRNLGEMELKSVVEMEKVRPNGFIVGTSVSGASANVISGELKIKILNSRRQIIGVSSWDASTMKTRTIMKPGFVDYSGPFLLQISASKPFQPSRLINLIFPQEKTE